MHYAFSPIPPMFYWKANSAQNLAHYWASMRNLAFWINLSLI